MDDWLRACGRDELADGEFAIVELDDTLIAVYRVGEAFFAIEDVCTHDGGELAGGRLCGYELECPRHASRFDLRSGKVLGSPALTDTRVFPVRLSDDAVYVRDDRWDD